MMDGLTGDMVLTQAKGGDDVLADFVLLIQGVEGRHAGRTDWDRGLLHRCHHPALTHIHRVWREEVDGRGRECMSTHQYTHTQLQKNTSSNMQISRKFHYLLSLKHQLITPD